MEQEERNKEIEWLMGSIQRSYAQGKAEAILLIVTILLAVIGVIFYVLNFNNDEIGGSALLLLLFLGAIGAIALIEFVFRKKLTRVETPQRLLTLHDRMWVIKAILCSSIIVGVCFLENSSLLSKVCLVLGLILLAITNWLAMNNKLSTMLGIAFLIAESVLLYFSKVDLFLGFAVLIVMLSVVQGKKTLFTGDKEDNLDEDIEQEIKQLRELLKESE